MRGIKVKVGNIECRKYTATKTISIYYEIVKWDDNPHYNKMQDYLDDGYEESFCGDFLLKDSRSIQKTSFNLPKYCFTIASLYKGEEWYLQSVGSRICELNSQELEDFLEVYKLANKKLNK
jgi:hypothetical protein